MPQKQTLIEFLVDLASNPGMQKKFRDGGAQWQQLVEQKLSAEDAQLILSEDKAAIETKVNEQKTAAHIVWTASSTVWM